MLITRRHLVAGAAASAVLPSALAPLGASAAVTNLKVTDLYAGGGELSKVALDLQGKDVQFQGYMAPPLKADSKFFVLTTIPMAVCPFCAEITEWPEDIVVIYTNRAIEEVPFEIKVNAFGKLDLGPWTDPATGFVSKVRLRSAEYRMVPTTIQGGQRVFQF